MPAMLPDGSNAELSVSTSMVPRADRPQVTAPPLVRPDAESGAEEDRW
jgi:hypothetical protein